MVWKGLSAASYHAHVPRTLTNDEDAFAGKGTVKPLPSLYSAEAVLHRGQACMSRTNCCQAGLMQQQFARKDTVYNAAHLTHI